MQTSKTIYFSDYPSTSDRKSGLTVPFSSEDKQLYEFVRPMSSHSIRCLIGFDQYRDILSAAENDRTQVATYVRKLLLKNLKLRGEPKADFFRIQSTFSGGRNSPLHQWYPYLEGYSPDFVSNILDTFAPAARDILDPFCGSGTTALVTAQRGGIGYYTEVNPSCQYIIEAKTLALTLSYKERKRVAKKLHEISRNIVREIGECREDANLLAAFERTFGKRPFFENKTFIKVLKARTFTDRLERDDPVAGRFVTVAVLRSLIPSSLLVRRGDLRFRTEKELARGLPDFFDEVSSSCDLIASDLIDVEAAPGRTHFIAGDARDIQGKITRKVDAVITSPPYLNGTNYFRNTKIELWFLRELQGKGDLRLFRDSAITSGINDVTRGKLNSAKRATKRFSSALLTETIRKLEESAYDSRIPAMVENYFYDMYDVLVPLSSVLNENGVIAIDLGDSIYSGIHVPTQDILTEMLEDSGFQLETTVVLRERKSRDGTPLRQTLQVFSATAKKESDNESESSKKARLSGWTNFKTSLPHQKGEMSRRNWGHKWHSMCSYQGKLKPSIARSLVDALVSKSNSRVLDPFSGVGTIPFEARMSGHTAFGFDISPAAVAISRAKLEKVDWSFVDKIIENLDSLINSRKRGSRKGLETIRFNGALESYFHKDTLREILIARQFFLDNKPESGAAALVFSSLLHILHGNRPYALSRRSHPITPFSPTGPTEYRSLIDRLKQKVGRCKEGAQDVPATFGKSYYQDVTEAWPEEVNDLDAIITSPPFFDSTRFHTANWMRLWFAGWNAKDFSERPSNFVDERQKKSFSIYESIFKQASERLRVGGYFAVHVGKSNKCDMAAAIQQIGERYLHLEDWFSESVEHCESHGIRDKGTVTHHQYLLFERVN